MSTFSKRMQYAMQLRGLKQVDICDKTGLPKGSISNYLKDRYHPKFDNLKLIADVLEVNPAWLFGFDTPMN